MVLQAGGGLVVITGELMLNFRPVPVPANTAMSRPSSPSTSPVFIPHGGNNPGPDDPLDADFEDFATRMLALPIQNYPKIPPSFMVVVKEALQVHRDRKKHDHGLPSHSWYDEAYPDLVPASVESENAGPWQGFDPSDKLYRMRWSPYRFYWWYASSTPPFHDVADSVMGTSQARKHPRMAFPFAI